MAEALIIRRLAALFCIMLAASAAGTTADMREDLPTVVDTSHLPPVTGDDEPTPDEDYGYEEFDDLLPSEPSTTLRRGKRVLFAIEPIGFAAWPVATFGLFGGIHSSPKLVLEGHYARGAARFGNILIKTESSGVRLKRFWTGVAYTNLGLGHRNARGAFEESTLYDGEEGRRHEASLSSLTVDFAFGHNWQFRHVIIGCDWIGVSHPLTVLSVTGHDPRDGALSGVQTEDWERYEKLALETSLQVARFYFGASF